MEFLIGGVAGLAATILSHPFDILKTRMHLQGELRPRGKHEIHYKTIRNAFYTIFKNEGFYAIERGLRGSVLWQAIRYSVILGTFQWFDNHGHLKDKKGNFDYVRSFLVSSASGGIGAFIGSPLYMMKTHVHSNAAKNIAVGYQHKHDSPFHGIKNIFKDHGIRGLWRGSYANVLKSIVGSSSQITSYIYSKDVIRRNEVLNERPVSMLFLSSFICGIIHTLTVQPFDLVSTRLYNQGTDARGKGLLYSGVIDCFLKTTRAEGFLGLYKGLLTNYMRLAPQTMFTFVFWDLLNDTHAKYKEKRGR